MTVKDSITAMCDSVGKMRSVCDDHRVIGGVQIPPTAEQIKNTMGLRFDASNFATKAEAIAEANKRRQAGEEVKVLERKFTNPRTGNTDTSYEVASK